MDLNPETRTALRAVGAILNQPSPPVAVGQLWRAEGDGEAVLGVIVGLFDDMADFAPATVDVHYATAYTVTLNEPLPVPLAVFTELTIPVPTARLTAFFGVVDRLADVTASWLAVRRGIPMPGEHDADAGEARRAFRLELSLMLGRIAEIGDSSSAVQS